MHKAQYVCASGALSSGEGGASSLLFAVQQDTLLGGSNSDRLIQLPILKLPG